MFSQRPRSHGGGTRWHSSTSVGRTQRLGSGRHPDSLSPERRREAEGGAAGAGQGRGEARTKARVWGVAKEVGRDRVGRLNAKWCSSREVRTAAEEETNLERTGPGKG